MVLFALSLTGINKLDIIIFIIISLGVWLLEGILAFWESWQNHVVNCEEMNLCQILGLNKQLKNGESKFFQ